MTDGNPVSNDLELLSADDAARRLGISKRTLQRMSHRGEGPPYVPFPNRRGITYRYPAAGITAWIEASTVVTAAQS